MTIDLVVDQAMTAHLPKTSFKSNVAKREIDNLHNKSLVMIRDVVRDEISGHVLQLSSLRDGYFDQLDSMD